MAAWRLSSATASTLISAACRNPDNDAWDMSAALRRLGFADLNEDLLGDETLVAYAVASGTTAADGRGRNSPYTGGVAVASGDAVGVGLLFRRVRAQVLEAANGAQRPHEYHSLVGEHYLARTLATGASVSVTATAPAAPALAGLHGRIRRRLTSPSYTSLRCASWPRRETPRRRPNSASGKKTVTMSAVTIGCPSCGTAGPHTRDTLAGRLTSVACTVLVAASCGMMRNPSGGTACPPARRTGLRPRPEQPRRHGHLVRDRVDTAWSALKARRASQQRDAGGLDEKRAAQQALYAKRRPVGGGVVACNAARARCLERSFAHMYKTGGVRRVWVRGHEKVRKRALNQAAVYYIGCS